MHQEKCPCPYLPPQFLEHDTKTSFEEHDVDIMRQQIAFYSSSWFC